MTSKYFRERYNFTQKEFAERFNIPLRTVQNWELRECMPEYLSGLLYEIMILDNKVKELNKEIRKLELESLG